MNTIEATYRKRLNTDYIIGCYHQHDGKAYFIDLRGKAGQRIQRPDGTPIESTRGFKYIPGLVEGEYYQFSWNVEGTDDEFEFVNCGNIQPLDKKTLLNTRLQSKLSQSDENRQDELQHQEMINREVTGAPHTYIYELLQNANDYPQKDEVGNKLPVSVKFILTDHYLFFVHNGEPFQLPNIVAICTVNEGDKRAKTDTIGYKGMGFKSVYVMNDYAYLQSGDWSLRFDKKHIKTLDRFEMPWQYMPIYTEISELDDEILETLENVGDDMLVKFALRHRNDASENVPNLDTVFSDERILIFIPNVDDVKVYIRGQEQYHVIKDRERWIIEHQDFPVSDDYKKILEDSSKTDNKIPEKFKKIESIRISFAVRKDGNRLLPVEDAKVYNYLPTEDTLSLPFLINADFVPNASRNGLPLIEWNKRLLQEAGQRYARWWASLMTHEGEYDLESIFSLLPEFTQSSGLRKAFMDGFESELVNTPCIPVLYKGEYKIVPFRDIILDNRGLVANENPAMSDELFYELTSYDKQNCYLPHPTIRCNSVVKKLLVHFLQHVGKSMDKDDYVSITYKSGFLTWMKENVNHAIAYYDFLFRSSLMTYQLECNDLIFLSESNDISKPNKLYYNVDEALKYIYMFEDRLPRLSKTVRESLKDDFNSLSSKGTFRFYSSVEVANNISNEFDDKGYSSRIKTKDDSLNFLTFLATANDRGQIYTNGIPSQMPIYLEDGSIHFGTDDVYISDTLGIVIANQSWIDNNWIYFIDKEYLSTERQVLARYIMNNGITVITPRIAWTDIISDDERIDSIVSAISDKSTNIEFYRFLKSIEEGVNIDSNSNVKNKLIVFATDGTNHSTLPISMQLYWKDIQWTNFINESWLPKECCWAIDDEYTESSNEDENESLRKFFSSKFIANKFSIADFFNKCIKSCWEEVITEITSKELSFELLKFLYDHRTEIEGSFKKERYQEIPLYYKVGDVDESSLNDLDNDDIVYQPCEALDILCNEEWFNSGNLYVLDDIYSSLFESRDGRDSFNGIGLKIFDLIPYVTDEIINNLSDYVDAIKDRTANIAFHTYMGGLYSKLSKDDMDMLKEVPIFLSSFESPEGTFCESSTDHYLPTRVLSDIIKLDIVPIEILDSIHPDYCSDEHSKEYFLGLGNCELAEDNFLQYISKKKDTVISYIQADKERNIRFWRWVVDFKASSDEMRELRGFPILTSSGQFVYEGNLLYTSDGFTHAKDTVELISKFIDNPSFVSEEYLEDDVERDWEPLLKALGVNVTPKHIVLNKLIPQLDKFKDKSVVYSMAPYANTIIKWIEDNDEIRIQQIEDLHLLCQDGVMRKIKDTLLSGAYVSLSNSTYPDIYIGNLVSEEYISDCGSNDTLKDNVIKLLVKIAGRFNKLRNDARVLRNAKIKYFLDNQQKYSDSDCHYRIIAELANDYKKDGDDDAFKKLFDGKELFLFDTLDESVLSTSLYFSPVYKPTCDFMSHGVTSLNFVSEKYAEYGDLYNLKKFFIWQLGVRQDFSENTLQCLNIEDFSRYFWEVFLPEANRIENTLKYQSLLSPESIGNMKCVPTKLGMQAPWSLYDSRIDKLVKMVSAIGKKDALIPDVKIPDGYLIGLRSYLTFDDCLLYLKTENPAYREIVYKTIVDFANRFPDKLNSYKRQGYIKRFREEARWYSGAKEWLPIKDLVALEWAEGHSLLKDNFGGSELVVSKMPEGKDDYNKLCEVLEITIITDEDFDHNCGENSKPDIIASQEIAKRLLYLSYKHFGDSWKEKYESIHKELSNTDIRKCTNISYFWCQDSQLSANLLSYAEDLDTLWYVGEWNGAMFVEVLEWLVKKFPFLKSFDFGFIKNCFYHNFKTLLEEREHGKLSSDFLECLSENDREGFGIEEYDETRIDEDVPQNQTYQEDTRENDEPIEKTDSKVNSTGDSSQPGESSKPEQRDRSKKENVLQHQNAPNSQSNIGDGVSNKEDETITEPEKSFREESHERWENDARRQLSAPTSGQSMVKDDVMEVFNPDEKPKADAEYGMAFDDQAKQSEYTPSNKHRKEVSDRDVRRAKEEERNARNKMSRREMLNEVPKYSLEWFNYRLDVCLEDQKSYSGKQVTLDFHDWCLIDAENHIYRLVSPDGYIPLSFADYNNQIVKIISNGKEWQVDARVLEADDSGIDLLCHTQLGEPMEGRRVQISAMRTGGFTDHLVSRFRRLSDHYNMATDLRKVLPDNIRFIYGPPGTGKTNEVVKRISEIVRTNYKINILVLTPTNRAADEVAERLCQDTFVNEHLSRYGVTESRILAEKYYDRLRNRQNMDISANKNVVVTTIARYPYDTVKKGQYSLNIFDIDWDYIIVDEASMIDVIDISLLLLNNKAQQFIIAGDPNQIRPITPFDIDQCNIYDMVDIKSFSEALNNKCKYPIDALDVQYRSVPQIGNLVSAFCYQGKLKNNPKREAQKPLQLTGINIETINTIGFNIEMFSYLYGWNKVDDSPVHVYSAIFAYEFAGYMANEIAKNHPKNKYTIGIVTPYGKQKEAIKQLLEQKPINTPNCDIKCGTAHSFQGGECDIIIVVMNYPDIYASEQAHINNMNIMNVAMSRARDYLFFLWPEVKEEHRRKGNSDKLPYLMNQKLGRLLPSGFNQLHAFDIEEVIFGTKTHIAQNSGARCHLPVNVSSPTMKKYEIRLSDTALDIQINELQ